MAVSYRECRRNHAASIGRYAYDGCGEFLKAGKDGTKEAFHCAACGCHRSFHRKELSLSVASVHRRRRHHDHEHKNYKAKTKRTKITEEQKSKMRRFADKLGWKPRRHDEEEVGKFCGEVGITRKMFKVWLNNNRRRPVPVRVPEKCRAASVVGVKNLLAAEE